MKKILIPTDFSQNAKKATDYALSLFTEKDIEVTLLNTFYIPYSAHDVAYSINDVTYDNAKQLFEAEQKRIKRKFPDLKPTIKTDFSIGEVVNVVNSMERKEAYDLIVMGTKGASGLAEVFVGSRTSEMIRSVKTPVLAIPEDATFNPPKRILFAADEKLIDRKVDMDILKEIANKHHSTIDALYISDSDENKETIEKFIDYELNLNFVDIPHELRMKRGDNVEKAIQEYTENYPIDLVAMITTKGNLFHNIFHKSVTKRVVMHTKMPLLVMHTNLKND
ncbi:MAG: universal stress protein [Vicingaceae bacterium]